MALATTSDGGVVAVMAGATMKTGPPNWGRSLWYSCITPYGPQMRRMSCRSTELLPKEGVGWEFCTVGCAHGKLTRHFQRF